MILLFYKHHKQPMVKGISQKHKAWILWEAGITSPKTLSRKGKIPERTARSYVNDFKAGKTWERKPYSPRQKTKVCPKVIRQIFNKALCRTRIYSAREIAAAVGISHSTVIKILNSKGMSYKSRNKKLFISTDNRKKRVDFAKDMQQRADEWKSTIITDEASFLLNKSRPGKVWTANPEEENASWLYGPTVHCWGGISARGALKLEIFEKNLNAPAYIDIMRRKIPEIERLYPDGWQWQQDGSGVHRASTVTIFIAQNMPQKMDWPPYSPDLSPIENIWAWLKSQVAKDVPKNVESLKKSIKRHWESMDVEFLAPYFDSMPNRMDMVIKNKGFKIKY